MVMEIEHGSSLDHLDVSLCPRGRAVCVYGLQMEKSSNQGGGEAAMTNSEMDMTQATWSWNAMVRILDWLDSTGRVPRSATWKWASMDVTASSKRKKEN